MKTLVVALWVCTAFGCGEGAGPVLGTASQALISDGAHGEGANGFHFLAPLPEVGGLGAFDRAVEPVVQLLELDADGLVGRVFGTYEIGSGVTVEEDRFRVDLPVAGLEYSTRVHALRVMVSAKGQALGLVDWVVSADETSAWQPDLDLTVMLAPGGILSLTFHTAEGVVVDDPCAVAEACIEAGCDGVVGSGLVFDACGVCGGDGSSCGGGSGGEGGFDGGEVCLIVDACGVCEGDGRSCAGCDGVPNSGKTYGCDGTCGGPKQCRAAIVVAGVVAAQVVGGVSQGVTALTRVSEILALPRAQRAGHNLP